MTYKQLTYAILVSVIVLIGCQREAAAPAGAPGPAQANSGDDDKVRIQLNLGKQGSVDIEKSDKSSN